MNNQRFDYTGINRVRIERALSVDILMSDSFSVTIGDDFSRIRMEKIGETLCIERRGSDWFVPFHPRPHIVITMPLLLDVTMGGACHGKLVGFQSNQNLGIKLTGACQLEASQIAAGNLRVEITGASNLTGDLNFTGQADFKILGASRAVLQGSGNAVRIELAGASQARFGSLAVHQADLRVSGASSAQLKVSDRLDFELAGASRLEYSGSPVIGRMQIFGASSINHR